MYMYNSYTQHAVMFILFFNLEAGWGWVASAKTWPLYALKRDPVAIYSRLGGPQGQLHT